MLRIRWSLLLLLLSLTSGLRAQYWESLGGPPGAAVYATAVSPQGHIYTFSKLVHRSTDQGNTWHRFPMNVPLKFGQAFTMSWDPSGTIYLFYVPNLWKSTDTGSTWTKVIDLSNASQFALSPTGKLITSLKDSILISSDGGQNWSASRPGDPPFAYATQIFVDKDEVIYVGAGSYTYRSTDFGSTWERIINGLPSRIDGPRYFVSPRRGVALTSIDRYLFMSTDSGRVWKQVHQSSGGINSLYVHSEDTIFLSTHSGLVQRSTDGGNTWETIKNSTAPFNDYFPPCLITSGRHIFMIRTVSFYKTDMYEEDVWHEVNLPTGKVTQLARSPSSEMFAVSWTTNTNYGGRIWKYNGVQWSADTTIMDKNIYDIGTDSSGNIFTSLDYVLMRSTDNGGSWHPTLYHIYPSSQFAATRDYQYALSQEGVFRSTDAGATWDDLHAADSMSKSAFTTLAASESHLFIGGMTRYLRSSDHGASWQEPVFPFIFGSGMVTAIDAVGQNVVLAAQGTGVYFSFDGGLTWENHSGGFDTITQLVITPSGTVFAAASTGVFEYAPATQTWKNVNNGILPGIALALALGVDGKIYAGTDGDGVYRTTKTWHTADVSEHRPNSNTISVYPNPASSSVVIHLPSAISDECRITIYNVLGEALPLRIDRSGSHTSIRVASLPNGRYIARLFDHDQVFSIPFIVQR